MPFARDQAHKISSRIAEEFDTFYDRFRQITYSAKRAFEQRAYSQVLMASRDRLSLYSTSMKQLSYNIANEHSEIVLEESLWDRIEKAYRLLVEVRYESDLAVAYMNSVRRSLFQSEWRVATYSGDNHTYGTGMVLTRSCQT